MYLHSGQEGPTKQNTNQYHIEIEESLVFINFLQPSVAKESYEILENWPIVYQYALT